MRNETEIGKRLADTKTQLKALIKMKTETIERKGKEHRTPNLDVRIVSRNFEINLLEWVMGE